jgi:hypothetical protein
LLILYILLFHQQKIFYSLHFQQTPTTFGMGSYCMKLSKDCQKIISYLYLWGSLRPQLALSFASSFCRSLVGEEVPISFSPVSENDVKKSHSAYYFLFPFSQIHHHHYLGRIFLWWATHPSLLVPHVVSVKLADVPEMFRHIYII